MSSPTTTPATKTPERKGWRPGKLARKFHDKIHAHNHPEEKTRDVVPRASDDATATAGAAAAPAAPARGETKASSEGKKAPGFIRRRMDKIKHKLHGDGTDSLTATTDVAAPAAAAAAAPAAAAADGSGDDGGEGRGPPAFIRRPIQKLKQKLHGEASLQGETVTGSEEAAAAPDTTAVTADVATTAVTEATASPVPCSTSPADTGTDAADVAPVEEEVGAAPAGAEAVAQEETDEAPEAVETKEKGWRPGKFARKIHDKIHGKLHGGTTAPGAGPPVADDAATAAPTAAGADPDSDPEPAGTDVAAAEVEADADDRRPGWRLRRRLAKGKAKLAEGAAKLKEKRLEVRAAISAKLPGHHRATSGSGTAAGGGAGPNADGACGRLSVRVVRGEHLPSRSFVDLTCEAWRGSTDVVSAPAGLAGWEGAAFDVPVHDPCSDLALFLMRERLPLRPRCVGRGAVPMASLLSGLTGTTGTRRLWLTLYPPAPKSQIKHSHAPPHKLLAGVQGVSGSAMERPTKDRPRLLVEVRLNLAVAPVAAYLTTAPFNAAAAAASSARHGDSSDSEGEGEADPAPGIDPKLLKRNVARIKAAAGAPALLAAAMSPPGAVIAWLVLFYLCFVARTWQYPLWAFLALLANGILAARQRAARLAEVVVWSDGLDPKQMKKGGVRAKLAKLANLIKGMQALTGKISRGLETVGNATNFADVRVTAVVLAGALAVALAAALVLAIFPLSLLAFLVLGVPTAGVTAVAFKLLPKHGSASDASDDESAHSAEGAAAGAGAGAGAGTAGSGGSGGDTSGLGRGKPSNHGGAGKVKFAARNLVSRIPDEQEMIHRYLCAIATEVAVDEVAA